jgi:predicted dehydrogenase
VTSAAHAAPGRVVPAGGGVPAPVRLGVVGAGAMVAEFLAAAPRVPGLEVVGLLARRPEAARELGARHGVPLVTGSFDALCAAGIDTVYVAVPNAAHVGYARRALERGLHVIVEKPMTSTVEEAEELQRLAAGRDLFLVEAVTTVHLDAFAAVRDWLPRIGDVTAVASAYHQRSRRYDAFLAGEVPPAFDPAQAGGALMDLGLYNLHLVLGLFGPPVSATYEAVVERGIDTSGVLVLHYPAFDATCTAAKDRAGEQGAVIEGSLGRITTSLSPNLIGSVRLELADGTVEVVDDGLAGDRLVTEFRAFVTAVATGDRGRADAWLAASLAVSRVQTAARRSVGVRFPADDAA